MIFPWWFIPVVYHFFKVVYDFFVVVYDFYVVVNNFILVFYDLFLIFDHFILYTLNKVMKYQFIGRGKPAFYGNVEINLYPGNFF